MPLLVAALQGLTSGYSKFAPGFALALLDACPQLAVMAVESHSTDIGDVVRQLYTPMSHLTPVAAAEVLRRLFAASPPTLAASLEPSRFLNLLRDPWSQFWRGRKSQAPVVQVLLEAQPSLAFPVVLHRHSEQSLPLVHALHAGCPVSVIEALLHAYPQAATETHKTTGYLPLHVAASHGCSAPVLEALLRVHLAAAAIKADEGDSYPIHCLVSSQNKENKDTVGSRYHETNVLKRASANAAVVLVKAFPGAAIIADASGNTPLAHVLHALVAQWWLQWSLRETNAVKQGLALLAALVQVAPAALHIVNSKGDPLLHVAAALDREEETAKFADDEAATLQRRRAKGGRTSSSSSRKAGQGCVKPATDKFASDTTTGGLPMLLVDALLSPDPTTAAAPDAEGRLPLHIVARRLHIGPLLQRVEPPAASIPDNHGALPLHHLSGRRWCCDRRTKVCAPMSKRRQSKQVAGKAGQCGILAASAAAAVNTLLDVYPAAALTANAKGELPLHVALKTGGVWGTAVATELLVAHPDAAAACDTAGNLPLHVALERGFDLKTVHALLDAHMDGAAERTAAGKLPLHVALERSGVESPHGLAIVRALLSANPGAAAEPDAVGQLALHLALALRKPCWTSAEHAARGAFQSSVMGVVKDAAEESEASQGVAADEAPLTLIKIILEANPKAVIIVNACGAGGICRSCGSTKYYGR
jgi:ankyrin repeat protein